MTNEAKEALIKTTMLIALSDKEVARTLFLLSGNISDAERFYLRNKLTEQVKAHLVKGE